MKTKTLKNLEAAEKSFEKIESARNRQHTYVANLDSEIRELEERHRQESLDAALAGETAPTTPSRITEARQELATGNSVMADLRERYEQARQAVHDAEQEHVASRRRAVAAKLEKAAQGHWKTLADAFVELVAVAGMDGVDAVRQLANFTAIAEHPHPVEMALKKEGLTDGKGSDSFSVLPPEAWIMDWSEKATEGITGEAPKAEITNRV